MMNSGLEQVRPDTAALIAALAQANGLSIDDYLHHIIEELARMHSLSFDDYLQSRLSLPNGQHQVEAANLAEIDQWLDELSEGTEHITPLPPDFSRADIYSDHP